MPQGQDMSMSNGNNNDMMMKMPMSFYWGKDAIVLFSGWPNQSVGMYILAILFVFFLAMVYEFVPTQQHTHGTSPIKVGLIQAMFYLIRISFLYLVMLAVMSFNVGIFVAAVAGHTFGFFITKSRALAEASREQYGHAFSFKV